MKHRMKLDAASFEAMALGSKDIELRLNDEKRQKLKLKDWIVFSSLTNDDVLLVQIKALHYYPSFKELYHDFDPIRLGYHQEDNPSDQDMEDYYSQQDIGRYGVLGIEIELIQIEVRPMIEEDIEMKGYIHYTSWNEAYTGLIDQSYLDKRRLEHCIDMARKYPSPTFVGLVQGKVVGFISFGIDREHQEDAGEIYALYLLADYQSIGLGDLMMKTCLEALKHYKKVYLWVLKENDKAVQFYKRHGFKLEQQVKRIPLMENVVIQQQLMVLNLDEAVNISK